ncbi:MAG: hypothetical protein E7411_08030 [Ruminococcaceae bacterium]|nr:hypothetical protein [Oscillospiraceae bacterium]
MKIIGNLFSKVLILIIVLFTLMPDASLVMAEETNLALKKEVFVSRETSGKEHQKTTDGLMDIKTSSKSWNAKSSDSITINLGAILDFNQIVVYEYSFQRANGYKLEISNDNISYTAVKEDSGIIASTERNFRTNAPHYVGVINIEKQSAQYIRLTVTEVLENKVSYIEEIEVYNSSDPDKFATEDTSLNASTDLVVDSAFGFKAPKVSKTIEENYAAGKPVFVSRETSGKYHERITDGIKNISTGGHAWNIKAGDYAIIDLGNAKEIDCVIVYEYSHLRAKDYVLELSNDMSSWTTVSRVTDYVSLNGETGEKSNAPHYYGKIEFDKTSARYVKLTINETAENKVAYFEEIEIYNKANKMPEFNAQPKEEEIKLSAPVVSESIPYSKEKFHIYLFIGQSNMNGRDNIPNSERVILKDVFLLNKEGKWEYAQPYPFGTKYSDYQGYNRYSSVDEGTKNGLNSASSFARAVTDNIPDDIGIGIISNARGGTSIEKWQKGSGEGLYEEAVRRTKEAISMGGTLKGILWLQGESCAKKEGYLDKLNQMVTDMRNDIGGIDDVPFIASEIIQSRPEGNVTIRKISEKIKASDYVSSVGTNTIDGLHYDAESQQLIGVRFAEKILNKIYGVTVTSDALLASLYNKEIQTEEIVPDYQFKIKINGKYLITDVEPIMHENRLFVPLRAIFEALNSTVEWEESTKKVTGIKGPKTVVMHIGSQNAYVNGVAVQIDVSPMLVNNRTLVPIRFISESLGAKVEWNQEIKTAYIELN